MNGQRYVNLRKSHFVYLCFTYHLPSSSQELSFFKESENFKTESISVLKGGKKAEQEEFERLLREV